MSREDDIRRISEALTRAREVLTGFTPGNIAHRIKERGDPLTEADEAVDRVLRETLPTSDEGWLSEETTDAPERLGRRRVWIVDPIDGTREFVDGVPEWCVSVGLVEDGEPVAGGICIVPQDLLILGSRETGVSVNGRPATERPLEELADVEVLASRSEVRRGEWERFDAAPFRVRPMGSVAAKLGLVAAGLADATWTLVPKHEWDVAGGAALVLAAGGEVWLPQGGRPSFNQASPKLPGFFAAPAAAAPWIRDWFERDER